MDTHVLTKVEVALHIPLWEREQVVDICTDPRQNHLSLKNTNKNLDKDKNETAMVNKV